jgi:lactate permease
METPGVPVDLPHWMLAIFPIVALPVFRAPRCRRAPEAGPMAMFAAAIAAVPALRTPWETLAVAGAKGMWDA